LLSQKVLSRERTFVDIQSPDLKLRSGIPKNLGGASPYSILDETTTFT
jgi:hypothetical protein